MKQIYRTGQEARKNDRVRYNQTIADGEDNTIAAGTETRVIHVMPDGLYVVGYKLLINPAIFDLVSDEEGNVRQPEQKQKYYRTGQAPMLRDKVRSVDPKAGLGIGTYLDVKGITAAGDVQFDDYGDQAHDPQMFDFYVDRLGNPRPPAPKQTYYRSGQTPRVRDVVRVIVDRVVGRKIGDQVRVSDTLSDGRVVLPQVNGEAAIYPAHWFDFVQDNGGSWRDRDDVEKPAQTWPRYISRSDDARMWYHETHGFYCVVQLGSDLDGNWVYQDGTIEGVVRADQIETNLAIGAWKVLPGKPDFAPLPVEPGEPYVDWSKPLMLRRGSKVELLKDTASKGERCKACLVTEKDGETWSSTWTPTGQRFERGIVLNDWDCEIVNVPPEKIVVATLDYYFTAHGSGARSSVRFHKDVTSLAYAQAAEDYRGTHKLPNTIEFTK